MLMQSILYAQAGATRRTALHTSDNTATCYLPDKVQAQGACPSQMLHVAEGNNAKTECMQVIHVCLADTMHTEDVVSVCQCPKACAMCISAVVGCTSPWSPTERRPYPESRHRVAGAIHNVSHSLQHLLLISTVQECCELIKQ